MLSDKSYVLWLVIVASIAMQGMLVALMLISCSAHNDDGCETRHDLVFGLDGEDSQKAFDARCSNAGAA